MCFVWIWEQTAIISLYNINWLVCITETECLLRGTDLVFKSDIQFRPKGLKLTPSHMKQSGTQDLWWPQTSVNGAPSSYEAESDGGAKGQGGVQCTNSSDHPIPDGIPGAKQQPPLLFLKGIL